MVMALKELLAQIVRGPIGFVFIILVGSISLFVYDSNYEMHHHIIDIERVIAQNQYDSVIEIQLHEDIAELYVEKDKLRILTHSGDEITQDLLKQDMYQDISYDERSNTLVIIT
ncbi:MAG: hypothetical protein ACLFPL_02525 [Candidatus Nanoarchaeia archaeon]